MRELGRIQSYDSIDVVADDGISDRNNDIEMLKLDHDISTKRQQYHYHSKDLVDRQVAENDLLEIDDLEEERRDACWRRKIPLASISVVLVYSGQYLALCFMFRMQWFAMALCTTNNR